MKVRVRLFALQRVQTGLRELDLEVPPRTSVAGAWRALVAEQPVLAGAEGIVRFARNGIYVGEEEVLADGDELAVIPPVAGGAGDPDGRPGVRLIQLTTERLEAQRIAALLDEVPSSADGAVATFVGRTRET